MSIYQGLVELINTSISSAETLICKTELLKHSDNKNNEEFVKEVLNKSKYIFSGEQFSSIVDQSHGESDLESLNKKYELDVKLFLDNDVIMLLKDDLGIEITLPSRLNGSNSTFEDALNNHFLDLSIEMSSKFRDLIDKETKRLMKLGSRKNLIYYVPYTVKISKLNVFGLFNEEALIREVYRNYMEKTGESPRIFIIAPTVDNSIVVKTIDGEMRSNITDYLNNSIEFIEMSTPVTISKLDMNKVRSYLERTIRVLSDLIINDKRNDVEKLLNRYLTNLIFTQMNYYLSETGNQMSRNTKLLLRLLHQYDLCKASLDSNDNYSVLVANMNHIRKILKKNEMEIRRFLFSDKPQLVIKNSELLNKGNRAKKAETAVWNVHQNNWVMTSQTQMSQTRLEMMIEIVT